MASASLSGISSGLDTNSLLDALMKVAQKPLTQYQQEKSSLQDFSVSTSSVKSKVEALLAKVKTMQSASNVLAYQATSGDDTVAQVTANGNASPGSYDIVVGQLASNQRSYSSTFANYDVAGLFGSGTFSFTVGAGSQVDIAVTGSDTLNTVRDKINASGAAVTASIVSTGSGYKLQIAGRDSGAANSVAFSESGTSLSMTNAVTAKDAKFKIDGLMISSATNSASDVLTGVTIKLKAVSSGAVYDSGPNTITGGTATGLDIATDISGVKSNIQGFVDAYNGVIDAVRATNSGGIGLARVESLIRDITSQEFTGLSSNFTSLAEIGILTSSSGGNLQIDSEDIEAALTNDFTGVAKIFYGLSASDGADGLAKKLVDRINDGILDLESGVIQTIATSTQSRIESIDRSIDSTQIYLKSYEDNLKNKFINLEAIMAKYNSQKSLFGG